VCAQYDGWAEAFAREAEDNPFNAHYDRPAVLRLAGDVRGARVLDAACGPGIYAEELIAGGAAVAGFDVSGEMVELARARLGDRAQIIQADLAGPLPFADDAFDLVVCALAIHYVRDALAPLREFHRVLRPGGRAVLSTQHPAADWLRKGGSYFDVREETDVWEGGEFTREDGSFTVRFWRRPLTVLCADAAAAGFYIERLVEPVPTDEVRRRWPDDWQTLAREPGFLALRLAKPPLEGPPGPLGAAPAGDPQQ
jgi:SAM-dependent methyltransferase